MGKSFPEKSDFSPTWKCLKNIYEFSLTSSFMSLNQKNSEKRHINSVHVFVNDSFPGSFSEKINFQVFLENCFLNQHFWGENTLKIILFIEHDTSGLKGYS